MNDLKTVLKTLLIDGCGESTWLPTASKIDPFRLRYDFTAPLHCSYTTYDTDNIYTNRMAYDSIYDNIMDFTYKDVRNEIRELEIALKTNMPDYNYSYLFKEHIDRLWASVGVPRPVRSNHIQSKVILSASPPTGCKEEIEHC